MRNIVIFCCLLFFLSGCSSEADKVNDEEVKNKITEYIQSSNIDELKKMKKETKRLKDHKDFHPMIAATTTGNIELLQLLHEWGFSYDEKDGSGNTPLHYAAYGGQNGMDEEVSVVEFLLKEKVKIDAKNEGGETPVLLSLNARENPETTVKLIEAGANIEQPIREGNTFLHEAILFNREDIVLYMLEKYPQLLNEQNDAKETPLYTAIATMNIDLAKLLLEKGADPNIATETGSTPLSIAVSGQTLEIITPLIQADANLKYKVNEKTILQLATETENKAVIKTIKEAMGE